MSIHRGLDKEDVIHIYHIHIYTHTVEYYSAMKRHEIIPFTATWWDLGIITLSEVSQTEKENITYDHYCMESNRNDTIELTNRNRLKNSNPN